MVGIGQTGSGKTLAFLLPALAHIQKVIMQSFDVSSKGKKRCNKSNFVSIISTILFLLVFILECTNVVVSKCLTVKVSTNFSYLNTFWLSHSSFN